MTHESLKSVALLDGIIESHRTYYEELSDTWRYLDTKAQSSIALVGIILAAIVAFLTKSSPLSSSTDRLLAILEIILLVVSAIFFCLVLLNREWELPPFYGSTQERLQELLDTEEDDREAKMRPLLKAEIADWRKCNEDVRKTNAKKESFLRGGQYLAFAAVLLLAVFASAQILKPSTEAASRSLAATELAEPLFSCSPTVIYQASQGESEKQVPTSELPNSRKHNRVDDTKSKLGQPPGDSRSSRRCCRRTCSGSSCRCGS